MKKTYECPECKKIFAFGFLEMVGSNYVCPHCNWQGPNPKVADVVNPKPLLTKESDVENAYIATVRFPAVNALSSIISVLAWVLFAVSMILGIMAFSNGGFLVGIPFIVGGVLILIVNLAVSQLLLLLLAIEENTRK